MIPLATVGATSSSSTFRLARLVACAALLALTATRPALAFGDAWSPSLLTPFLAPSVLDCLCVSDEFDDGTLGPTWEPFFGNTCSDVREEGGALILEAQPCGSSQGIASVLLANDTWLCDDFVLTLPFSLENFGPAESRRWSGVTVMTSPEDIAGLIRYRTGVPGDPCEGSRPEGLAMTAGEDCGTMDVAGDSGKFRIVREGGTISVTYFDGSVWIPGPAAPVDPLAPALILLYSIVDPGTTSSHRMRVERAGVTSSSPDCPFVAVQPATWGKVRAMYR